MNCRHGECCDMMGEGLKSGKIQSLIAKVMEKYEGDEFINIL